MNTSKLDPEHAPALYAIVDGGYVADEAMPGMTRALIRGGAGILQLRAKGREPADITRLARQLLPICRGEGINFIINDHPHIAADIGADGVHIGQDDGTLEETRAVVGADAIIGRSTHSLEQALAADSEGFDYLGFGPLFPTGTKPGRPAIGLADIATAMAKVQRPLYCIGGINESTLPAVLAAGARRIVVVSALLQAKDSETATRRILEMVRGGIK
ncbi:MAG: thiamine phosphate synthase [Verrucomicrobiales bacterium]